MRSTNGATATIAAFATQIAIPTAMTGMLTPIPHTPLAERLRSEGRLREAEFSGNNTDDVVQFVPQRMTAAEMQRGYYAMLGRLFSPTAMYRRSSALIDRLEPHIFRGGGATRSADVRAAMRSLWRQGVAGASRREYFRLLWKGVSRDAARFREAGHSAAQMTRKAESPGDPTQPSSYIATDTPLASLIDHTREAVLRAEPQRPIAEVDAWARSLRERIEAQTATAADLDSLYRWSREYFVRQQRLHRFPGAYLVKAFNLAIKGLHYHTGDGRHHALVRSLGGRPPSGGRGDLPVTGEPVEHLRGCLEVLLDIEALGVDDRLQRTTMDETDRHGGDSPDGHGRPFSALRRAAPGRPVLAGDDRIGQVAERCTILFERRTNLLTDRRVTDADRPVIEQQAKMPRLRREAVHFRPQDRCITRVASSTRFRYARASSFSTARCRLP